MKLRIRGNSVRLRLLQSEVAQLSETGRIDESIVFGSSENEVLTYAIQISDTASEVSAGFCENEICIILPQNVADKWIESDQVGISAQISDNTRTLEIQVEKDFVCLTRTDDPDNKDAFPNPDLEC